MSDAINNNNMKIAMLSLHSCPLCKPGSRYNGGMSIYIRELVQELAAGGHHIDIYTGSHGDEEHGCDLLPERNVRLIHIKSGNPNLSDIADMNSTILDMCDQIQACGSGYDIIHSHYWMSGLAGLKLAEHWKVPQVSTFHTLGAIKNSLGLNYEETAFRLDSEAMIARDCHAIIATTEREKCEIARMSGCDQKKIYRVPCGVNTRTFGILDRSLARKMCGLDSKVIGLFVGRADPVKGLSLLLKATECINIPDFQMLIIGGDNTTDQGISIYESNDTGTGISGKVNFIGSVDHGDMYRYYNAADFCVIPSYYESFSLVALESLACGTPLLAADVGGIQEIAGHNPNCCIIPSISADNLCSGLEHMISDIKENPPDKGYLRSLVRNYDWKLIAQQILAIYFEAHENAPHKAHPVCR
jgi:D-inositol-3-phosphate glycosyltransferase